MHVTGAVATDRPICSRIGAETCVESDVVGGGGAFILVDDGTPTAIRRQVQAQQWKVDIIEYINNDTTSVGEGKIPNSLTAVRPHP